MLANRGRMSAFAVAIRGKADMTFCAANVCFFKADIGSLSFGIGVSSIAKI